MAKSWPVTVSDDRDLAALPELPRPRWMTVLGWLAAVFSILCLVGTIATWVVVRDTPFEPVGETIVTTQADLERFVADTASTAVDPQDPPVYIPTGVMVQSLEFKGPYTLQMAGYLWQRYPLDQPNIDRGVVFPEADTTVMTKVYETTQGDEVLVGWQFKATLRQQFAYGEYPLDSQEMWLQMWHVDFEKNVFLVPDLTGYRDLRTSTLPGVDPQVVLENWELGASFFSFRMTGYNADFGIAGYDPTRTVPELYFTIVAERSLLGPLFSQGIAPFIILLQLFVIVMVIGRNSKKLELFGVRPGAVLFTCAAYVFATLVAQNGLRSEVRWPTLVYLEGLHVITYVAIVGVALNSVLLVSRPELGLFKHGNAWVRILYWPVITGAILAITAVTFW